MGENPSCRTSGGACYEGREAVRTGLAGMCLPATPDGLPPPPPLQQQGPYFFADRSLSYWTLLLPGTDGALIPVRGIDVITYDEAGRFLPKDAYRKLS